MVLLLIDNHLLHAKYVYSLVCIWRRLMHSTFHALNYRATVVSIIFSITRKVSSFLSNCNRNHYYFVSSKYDAHFGYEKYYLQLLKNE